MNDAECRPPPGTKPDTNHTLQTKEGGEQWANWNGCAWRGLGRSYGGKGNDLTPAEAARAGLVYRFGWGSLNASVKTD